MVLISFVVSTNELKFTLYEMFAALVHAHNRSAHSTVVAVLIFTMTHLHLKSAFIYIHHRLIWNYAVGSLAFMFFFAADFFAITKNDNEKGFGKKTGTRPEHETPHNFAARTSRQTSCGKRDRNSPRQSANLFTQNGAT
jgi:hypothetical protein